MSPVTHFLASWTIANSCEIGRRGRLLVTIAGVIPDLDGLGYVAERLTVDSEQPLLWYSKYHHVLAHNLGCALLVTLLAFFLSRRSGATALLSFVSFHVHLLCDLIGSRGPDGYQWPIPYLLPFSRALELKWQGQWQFDAWPNKLIGVTLLGATIFLAWKRGCSPFEMVSRPADEAFVGLLRRWFGSPRRLTPPAPTASCGSGNPTT